MKNQENWFVIYPKQISEIKDLNLIEKLLLSAIKGLSKNCPCTATNEYFGNIINRSPKTVCKWINSLKIKGYIYSNVYSSLGNKREINLTKQTKDLFVNSTVNYAHYEVEGIPSIKGRVSSKSSTNNINDNKEKELYINNPFLLIKTLQNDKFNNILNKHDRNVKDWKQFEVNFNSKVIEEKLSKEPNILLARFERMYKNWTNYSRQNKNEFNAPGPKLKRII